ncbi:MAG TPA: phosphoadenosine phosphosulfate reductase family protein, partial [Gemmatimonadales bacterium]|nr:phosphoadenosine phosphosulfate reductase family protein [Gemmatimonadales bacterium]
MRIVRDIDADIGEDSPPERVVGWLLQRFAGRRMVVTTGFGMEGCALVDMIARHGGVLPVLYLDTGFLFPETLRLRDRLAARYPGLSFERRSTALTPEAQELR